MVRCWGGSHSGKVVEKMLPPFSGLSCLLAAINSSSRLQNLEKIFDKSYLGQFLSDFEKLFTVLIRKVSSLR